MAQEELTWPKAIAKVLASSATPLHYKEITERIIARSLRRSLGATPAATVNAQLANSIKQRGEGSPYIRVAKGIFALRGAAPPRRHHRPAQAHTRRRRIRGERAAIRHRHVVRHVLAAQRG